MRNRRGFAATVGFLILLLAIPALSQNITGVITGTVTDSGGAVIPNAQVTLTACA